MAFVKDYANKRLILRADGTGSQRTKIALPTPPAGTNQVLYIMRYWATGTSSKEEHFSLSWPNAFHYGFSFDGVHPTKPSANDGTAHDAAYANFFGPSQCAYATGGSAEAHGRGVGLSSDSGRWFFVMDESSSTEIGLNENEGRVMSGSGDLLKALWIDTNLGVPYINNVDAPYAIPTSGHEETTILWRVYSSGINDSVICNAWINTDGINLKSLDLSTIDPDNPKGTFPVSDSMNTQTTINGAAETGTNWRPSTGVMAFPTHFLAAWPFPTIGRDFVIDYIGVHYSQLT